MTAYTALLLTLTIAVGVMTLAAVLDLLAHVQRYRRIMKHRMNPRQGDRGRVWKYTK